MHHTRPFWSRLGAHLLDCYLAGMQARYLPNAAAWTQPGAHSQRQPKA
ncbi:hypothetical protein [Curtobacterium citreum]|nr:hypothetical protein [Curtobacterium albidum]